MRYVRVNPGFLQVNAALVDGRPAEVHIGIYIAVATDLILL